MDALEELREALENFCDNTKGVCTSEKFRTQYFVDKICEQYPDIEKKKLSHIITRLRVGCLKSTKILTEDQLRRVADWFYDNEGGEFFVETDCIIYCLEKLVRETGLKKDTIINMCELGKTFYNTFQKQHVSIEFYENVIGKFIELEDKLCYNSVD